MIRLLTLFIMTFGIYLLVTAPATWFDYLARQYSDQKITLTQASGTLWQGSATPAILTDKLHHLPIKPLHWKIDWPSILNGHLDIQFQWDQQREADRAPVQIRISPEKIILTDLNIPLPAQTISELTPMLKPVGLGGKLTLTSDQLIIHHNGDYDGQAILQWEQASSALTPVSPLGHYQIRIEKQEQVSNIRLQTLSGALKLEGSGTWSPQRGIQFNGTAQAVSQKKMLKELLHHIGPAIRPGVHQFKLISQ